MLTVLYSLLVSGMDHSQGAIVMCGRPIMARSVTEGWSHDKGRGGRSVTGVQWGHETQKCNWEHGNVMSGQRS